MVPCTDKVGNDNHILLMYIPASSELHANQADEVYMRVGDKSRKLSFEERIQLMYDKGERYYEDTAVYGATVDDIDMTAVERYTELIGYAKSAKQYLHENNNLITTNAKGEEQVSVACILLFGKYPQKFFPRGRTRFIRYKDTEERVGAEMNVIKDVTFEGSILDQVEGTIAYLETQVEEHTFLGQHGQFVTNRDFPKFVIQEMVVNACCHRAYNIKRTEIQIKMFDNRLVFESPGRLPGMVKPSNIRHTHFSRNPKIAQFLKAYDYVKEFGEGVDRVCRELEANGTPHLSFHLDDFILKITVSKVAENSNKVAEKVAEANKKVIERLIEKANAHGGRLTANRIKILELMLEDSYISRADLAKNIGINETSIYRNIEVMRGRYLRRVGPDNGGFWEIIGLYGDITSPTRISFGWACFVEYYFNFFCIKLSAFCFSC